MERDQRNRLEIKYYPKKVCDLIKMTSILQVYPFGQKVGENEAKDDKYKGENVEGLLIKHFCELGKPSRHLAYHLHLIIVVIFPHLGYL